MSARNNLIFRMGVLETQAYTLNHYYKGVVSKIFPEKKPCLQLVPDVQRTNFDDDAARRLYKEGTQSGAWRRSSRASSNTATSARRATTRSTCRGSCCK